MNCPSLFLDPIRECNAEAPSSEKVSILTCFFPSRSKVSALRIHSFISLSLWSFRKDSPFDKRFSIIKIQGGMGFFASKYRPLFIIGNRHLTLKRPKKSGSLSFDLIRVCTLPAVIRQIKPPSSFLSRDTVFVLAFSVSHVCRFLTPKSSKSSAETTGMS